MGDVCGYKATVGNVLYIKIDDGIELKINS